MLILKLTLVYWNLIPLFDWMPQRLLALVLEPVSLAMGRSKQHLSYR
jgi:hypothetical protein